MCYVGALDLEDCIHHARTAEVEKSEHCRAVLRQRMAEGSIHKGAIFDDITRFKVTPQLKKGCSGIAAGFPCQVP